ncbi:hypothetical protein [Hyphomonas sp.]|uniref:hypothetical protein n=1 Tax=Hyphomonas sp. TaxID=87 RepID=UPI0025BE98A5|nr:hypothetical protein [Hyphomonas sp.]MBI1398951.1 hypothetical protein [Hyphomonas sp.]
MSTLVRIGLPLPGGATPWACLGLLQLSMFSMSESLIFWHPNAFSCTLFTFYATAALVPAVRQAKSLPVLPPRGRLQPAPAA